LTSGVLIIGLGQIGLQYDLNLKKNEFVLTHSRAFNLHKDFDLLASVDNNIKYRSEFSRIYGLPSYDSLDEALKKHTPDVVVIATNTQTHAKILNTVLELLTPRVILCEKPLSYHANEAKYMVELCKSKGVDLFVNYMRRSDIGVIEIKRLIESRNFNECYSGVCWYSKGLIHNGSHFFNLLEYWLGPMMRFKIINKNKERVVENDCEPDLEVEFKRGRIVFLSAREEFFSHYTIELMSSFGRIRYDDEGKTIQFQDVVNDPIFDGYKILNPKSKYIVTNMEFSQLNVVDQLSKYIKGDKAYLCSGQEALNTLKSMQLIINKT
jgi:predicted dehydrogenase